jgi:hypothetical protein
MQTSTVAEVIRQKKLAKRPVVDYREENGKAVIEIQLRTVKSTSKKTDYDPEKLLAILRSGRIDVGYVTNVTRDIRRERNSSPSIRRPRGKSKKS